MGDFKVFEDLEVYKSARDFRRRMYDLADDLPDLERENLISSIRKTALFMTNCIAQGHGRYDYNESVQFMRQARASLQVLIDDINCCLDEEYVTPDYLEELKQDAYRFMHKLNGYIAYLKKKTENKGNTN